MQNSHLNFLFQFYFEISVAVLVMRTFLNIIENFKNWLNFKMELCVKCRSFGNFGRYFFENFITGLSSIGNDTTKSYRWLRLKSSQKLSVWEYKCVSEILLKETNLKNSTSNVAFLNVAMMHFDAVDTLFMFHLSV